MFTDMILSIVAKSSSSSDMLKAESRAAKAAADERRALTRGKGKAAKAERNADAFLASHGYDVNGEPATK